MVKMKKCVIKRNKFRMKHFLSMICNDKDLDERFKIESRKFRLHDIAT